jgi:hypothetical protein
MIGFLGLYFLYSQSVSFCSVVVLFTSIRGKILNFNLLFGPNWISGFEISSLSGHKNWLFCIILVKIFVLLFLQFDSLQKLLIINKRNRTFIFKIDLFVLGRHFANIWQTCLGSFVKWNILVSCRASSRRKRFECFLEMFGLPFGVSGKA